MNGYSWVAVISIFCYLFLFLTFVTVKKPKKVIRTFMLMLAVMILWNGGSLGMRLELWPSPYFWHHVSLLGMIMVAVGYFHFVLDFLDEKRPHGRNLWIIFYAALFIFNCLTNFFIPLPEIVRTNGQTQFLYHYDWHVYLLFAFIIVTILQLICIIWRHCRGNRISLNQLIPVISGLLIMLLGHTLTVLPMFVGFPVDMLSGAINTIFLFYALYKKKLFRMSILLSKHNCALIAIMVGIVCFVNLALPAQTVLMQQLGMSATAAALVIAIVLIAVVVAVYFIIKSTLNALFTHTEHHHFHAYRASSAGARRTFRGRSHAYAQRGGHSAHFSRNHPQGRGGGSAVCADSRSGRRLFRRAFHQAAR